MEFFYIVNRFKVKNRTPYLYDSHKVLFSLISNSSKTLGVCEHNEQLLQEIRCSLQLNFCHYFHQIPREAIQQNNSRRTKRNAILATTQNYHTLGFSFGRNNAKKHVLYLCIQTNSLAFPRIGPQYYSANDEILSMQRHGKGEKDAYTGIYYKRNFHHIHNRFSF